MKKYKILRDYRSEGYKFDDKEFEKVSDAVKEAIESGYSAPFLIVEVIEWEAIVKPK